MAQITNVSALTIGDLHAPSPTVLQPIPDPSKPVRTVKFTVAMAFTPQEIGLTYRFQTSLYATDRLSDGDAQGKSILIVTEDAGREKIADLSTGLFLSFPPKSYTDLVVNNTTMTVSIEREIPESKLDEDPGFALNPNGPPSRFKFFEDELFARVSLSVVAESPVLHQTM
jgi:hypothetical protein